MLYVSPSDNRSKIVSWLSKHYVYKWAEQLDAQSAFFLTAVQLVEKGIAVTFCALLAFATDD